MTKQIVFFHFFLSFELVKGEVNQKYTCTFQNFTVLSKDPLNNHVKLFLNVLYVNKSKHSTDALCPSNVNIHAKFYMDINSPLEKTLLPSNSKR